MSEREPTIDELLNELQAENQRLWTAMNKLLAENQRLRTVVLSLSIPSRAANSLRKPSRSRRRSGR